MLLSIRGTCDRCRKSTVAQVHVMGESSSLKAERWPGFSWPLNIFTVALVRTHTHNSMHVHRFVHRLTECNITKITLLGRYGV